MSVSRRQFLQYCGIAAGTLGLSKLDLLKLEEALANPNAPSVVWLQGSACAGCSISFLNRISTTAPTTAADVLVNSINLVFHQTLMASAGESAVAMIDQAKARGKIVLVVEGGVPTAFGGHACIAWKAGGKEVTFEEALKTLAPAASHVVCVGTCSSFGGVPAAGPNVAGIQRVSTVIGRSTVNIPGCAPHPDWITWAIVQILLGKTITVDSYSRPTALYGKKLHDVCPYKGKGEAKTFGTYGNCLKEIGCKGPETKCSCSSNRWNNGVSWCVEAGAPCTGCTEPFFGTRSFYKS